MIRAPLNWSMTQSVACSSTNASPSKSSLVSFSFVATLSVAHVLGIMYRLYSSLVAYAQRRVSCCSGYRLSGVFHFRFRSAGMPLDKDLKGGDFELFAGLVLMRLCDFQCFFLSLNEVGTDVVLWSPHWLGSFTNDAPTSALFSSSSVPRKASLHEKYFTFGTRSLSSTTIRGIIVACCCCCCYIQCCSECFAVFK